MSFKRPTEVSWDSDEDEELLSFNPKFKADDDEDLDEDALLGSDEESSFSDNTGETELLSSEGKTSTAAINNRNTSTTFKKPHSVSSNNNTSHTNSGKRNGDTVKTKQSTPKSAGKSSSNKNVPDVYNEPEPVLLLDPEESYDFDESGVTEAILDSSQGDDLEDQFVKPQAVISRPPTQATPANEGQVEEELGEDQSDVSALEMSEDQGKDSSDESDDSDSEHGRRRRFKTERQGSIKLPAHKSATDIPDTLEISKEQEKEIEQFMHHGQNKSKFQRGRGRGNRGQHRMGLNRGQRSGLPANQNRNNHLPPRFSHEGLPNHSLHQGSSPPVSKPQKIHINPHFRPAGMPPTRQGDSILPGPAIPPLHRPAGPPSLLSMHTSPPMMHSAPQSAPWGHQAAPQPMYSKPQQAMHQVQNHHPPHQFPPQQPPPRHGVPYSDYSRGPPSYPPHGQQQMRPPHVPHSRPPFQEFQEFPSHSQFSHSGPPHPQLMPQRHQYSHPQQPPQPLMRGEPQHPHNAHMRPPSQHPQNGPPQGSHPSHPQYGHQQQQYSQQRYPSPGQCPEAHVRPNFSAPPHHQQQQQQQPPPRFQQRAPGFQNQPRPQRFQPPGERMPHNNNNNNSGPMRNPVPKPKQNVLLAHAKKLKERAKKFGQNPQATPSKPITKPLKRPSTEVTGSQEVSPVKQIKVETEKPMTPEDRELQEKLALQAKQREMIRQRKEANRQALAQKKREQLAQRLANKGQTIEDIEQPSTADVQSNPVHIGFAPGNQPKPGGQQIQSRPANPQISHPNQNAQRKVVTPSGDKPVNKPTTNIKSPNKKLMKRIETVKKNSLGEIISREIKLVPIEDETDASLKTSVLNQGKVQVVKTTTPVSNVSVNRSVVAPVKSVEIPNRSVIRLGTQAQENEGGDMRNVISQQTSGRRIVVSSKPKSVLVKNLSATTSDIVIKNLCSNVGPVESIERKEKDAVITFMNGVHASVFAEKYNRSLLDLSTILVSLIHY